MNTSLTFRSKEPILIPLSFNRVIEIWKVYDQPHRFRFVLPSGARSSIREGESFVLRPGREISIFVDGNQEIKISRAPTRSQRILLDLPVGVKAWKRREYAEQRKPRVFALSFAFGVPATKSQDYFTGAEPC